MGEKFNKPALFMAERRGMEIIDPCIDGFVVARDGDDFVFIASKAVSEFGDYADEFRERFEKAACEFFAENDLGSAPVRLDVAEVKALDGDRVFVRYEVDAA